MFAVTFTANRDSRWLYEILQFLFKRIEELNDQEFGAWFKDFLEKMAVRYLTLWIMFYGKIVLI